MKLPAFKITYDDGDSLVSSAAAGVTLADAKAYWLGSMHIVENFDTGAETRRKCVKVEQVSNPYPIHAVKQMREWLADCSWGEGDAIDFETMDATAIIKGVDAFFDGGLDAFMLTVQQVASPLETILYGIEMQQETISRN